MGPQHLLAIQPMGPQPLLASQSMGPQPLLVSQPMGPQPLLASQPMGPQPLLASQPMGPQLLLASQPQGAQMTLLLATVHLLWKQLKSPHQSTLQLRNTLLLGWKNPMLMLVGRWNVEPALCRMDYISHFTNKTYTELSQFQVYFYKSNSQKSANFGARATKFSLSNNHWDP